MVAGQVLALLLTLLALTGLRLALLLLRLVLGLRIHVENGKGKAKIMTIAKQSKPYGIFYQLIGKFIRERIDELNC